MLAFGDPLTLKLFLATTLMVCPMMVCPIALRADITAYNNFGAGDSYNTSESISTDYEDAQAFSVSVTGDLASLTFALDGSEIANPPSVTDIFLYQDNGSGAPGSLLESFSFNLGEFSNPATNPQNLVVTVDSPQAILLTAGQEYWVGIQAADPSTNPVSWYFANSGTDAGFDVFFDGAWVAEDPQPSTPATLLVTEESPGAAPEPASWALLAIGLLFLVSRQSFPRVFNR
jgi:hypothetical protein